MKPQSNQTKKYNLYIFSNNFFKEKYIIQLENYFNVKLIKKKQDINIKKNDLIIWVDDSKDDWFLDDILPDIIFTNRYDTLNKFNNSLILPYFINTNVVNRIRYYLLSKSDSKSTKNKFKNKTLQHQLQLNNINIEIDNLNKEKVKLKKELESLKHEQETIRQKDHFFRQELKLAGELQKDLLPKSFPFENKVEFSSINLPSKYIGGDFYDIIKINENKFAVFIIDVAGHGIRSAIIASMSKILFHNYILNTDNLLDAIKKINMEFYNSIFNDDDFLTAFVIVIDLKEMKAQYINAGHPAPLVINPNGEIEELKKGGFFIGSFNDTIFEEGEIEIDYGYRFLLYTDGIIETIGSDETLFGKKRLINTVEQNNYLPLPELSNKILTELLFYSKNPSFTDDITLVLFELM